MRWKFQEVAMAHANQLIFVVLIVLSFFPVGCFSSAASSRRNPPQVPPTKATLPDSSRPPSRPTSGDTSFASYTESENHALIRFPRNYALLDGDPEDGSADLRTQQTLAEEQPGAILLATMIVPDDAYPNTTFVDGSVQFALNRSITPEACRHLPIARGGDVGTVTIQNAVFTWEQDASAAPSSDLVERDYAGFANGACYEFFLRVRTGDVTDEEDPAKLADPSKILRHLEKIVLSLQLPGRP
jgi:hypothetical protein